MYFLVSLEQARCQGYVQKVIPGSSNCFSDLSFSSQTKNVKGPRVRKTNKNQYTKQSGANNEKFMRNLSHKKKTKTNKKEEEERKEKRTDQVTASLAKRLKFMPTAPLPASHKKPAFKSLPAMCAYNIYFLT